MTRHDERTGRFLGLHAGGRRHGDCLRRGFARIGPHGRFNLCGVVATSGTGRRFRGEVVIIAPDLSMPGKILLRATNPKLAFACAARWLVPPAPIAQGIHPTAVIAPSAIIYPGAAVGPYTVIEEEVQIGAGTEIGAFCFLGRGARVGEGCRLYPRVTLYAGALLANRVILHSGAVIGSDGFGYVSEGGKRMNFPGWRSRNSG